MGDLSTAQQTMGLSVALVEMTILGEVEESNSKDKYRDPSLRSG
jgi:hypothetical protein